MTSETENYPERMKRAKERMINRCIDTDELQAKAMEKHRRTKFKVGDWVISNDDGELGKIYICARGTYFVGFHDCTGTYHSKHLTLVQPLEIRYLNYKDEQSWRKVIPLKTVYKSSEWHNDGNPTWIMEAYDLDKEANRDFCMQDILQVGRELSEVKDERKEKSLKGMGIQWVEIDGVKYYKSK